MQASRLTPLVKQVATGLAMGTGGCALVGANTAMGVAAGRQIDPNNAEESVKEQHNADVWSAGASFYATRRVMMTKTLPMATRVGASVPAAFAAGLAASWLYQKSGPSVKAVIGALGGAL